MKINKKAKTFVYTGGLLNIEKISVVITIRIINTILSITAALLLKIHQDILCFSFIYKKEKPSFNSVFNLIYFL